MSFVFAMHVMFANKHNQATREGEKIQFFLTYSIVLATYTTKYKCNITTTPLYQNENDYKHYRQTGPVVL
jgi:hypothetical protein